MRLKNKMSLKHVVFKGVGREAISEPYFDADKKAIVATNGTVLVILPVEDSENDISGHLPIDAITMAQKQDRTLIANGIETVEVVGEKIKFFRPDVGPFPQIEGVTRPADNAKKAVSFNIDLGLLKAVMEAFGSGEVTVEVPEDDHNPLRVLQDDKLAYVMRMK